MKHDIELTSNASSNPSVTKSSKQTSNVTSKKKAAALAAAAQQNSTTNEDDDEDDEKQMVGGCCVCADDTGYSDNMLVYCDGIGCHVAVHQGCYGIQQVPEGPWFCRRCEYIQTQIKNNSPVDVEQNRLYCELCPCRDGAIKRTDTGKWAHVICALYIPEITFGNVRTMEPLITKEIRSERYNKKCSICELNENETKDLCGDSNGPILTSDNSNSLQSANTSLSSSLLSTSSSNPASASTTVYVNCRKAGCKHWFHVTCAQSSGLLCEDHSYSSNNVSYSIYCKFHCARLMNPDIKRIPAFKFSSSSKSALSTSPSAWATITSTLTTTKSTKEKTTKPKELKRKSNTIPAQNSNNSNQSSNSLINTSTSNMTNNNPAANKEAKESTKKSRLSINNSTNNSDKNSTSTSSASSSTAPITEIKKSKGGRPPKTDNSTKSSPDNKKTDNNNIKTKKQKLNETTKDKKLTSDNIINSKQNGQDDLLKSKTKPNETNIVKEVKKAVEPTPTQAPQQPHTASALVPPISKAPVGTSLPKKERTSSINSNESLKINKNLIKPTLNNPTQIEIKQEIKHEAPAVTPVSNSEQINDDKKPIEQVINPTTIITNQLAANPISTELITDNTNKNKTEQIESTTLVVSQLTEAVNSSLLSPLSTSNSKSVKETDSCASSTTSSTGNSESSSSSGTLTININDTQKNLSNNKRKLKINGEPDDQISTELLSTNQLNIITPYSCSSSSSASSCSSSKSSLKSPIQKRARKTIVNENNNNNNKPKTEHIHQANPLTPPPSVLAEQPVTVNESNENSNNNKNNVSTNNSVDIFGNHLNTTATFSSNVVAYKNTIKEPEIQNSETINESIEADKTGFKLPSTVPNTSNDEPKPSKSVLNPVQPDKTTDKKKQTGSVGTASNPMEVADSDDEKSTPETLEELLLKQWDLGNELVEQQSTAFDVVDLLNLLNNCKKENQQLEKSLVEMEKKYDYYLSLNKKLGPKLNDTGPSPPPVTNQQPHQVNQHHQQQQQQNHQQQQPQQQQQQQQLQTQSVNQTQSVSAQIHHPQNQHVQHQHQQIPIAQPILPQPVIPSSTLNSAFQSQPSTPTKNNHFQMAQAAMLQNGITNITPPCKKPPQQGHLANALLPNVSSANTHNSLLLAASPISSTSSSPNTSSLNLNTRYSTNQLSPISNNTSSIMNQSHLQQTVNSNSNINNQAPSAVQASQQFYHNLHQNGLKPYINSQNPNELTSSSTSSIGVPPPPPPNGVQNSMYQLHQQPQSQFSLSSALSKSIINSSNQNSSTNMQLNPNLMQSFQMLHPYLQQHISTYYAAACAATNPYPNMNDPNNSNTNTNINPSSLANTKSLTPDTSNTSNPLLLNNKTSSI